MLLGITHNDTKEQADYLKSTLLDYYKDKGLLVNIDKISNPEETFTEIEKVIK